MASTATEGNSTITSGVPRSGSSWLEDAIEAVDRNWPWALAGLMLAEFLLLLYMGRGLSFFYDDWNYVTQDYGGGIHSLLTPHNGHLSVIPIAIYKVLFHIVGLNHYAVFRLVVIVLHLICGGLVFVLAARRIPRVPALLATALILFLGAAWEDLLWAFQMSYLLSVAGGLGAWVLLERDDLRSKSAVMLCLIVALGSSSLGIAIVIGVAAELAWGRRWRTAWVVAVPVLLYAIWYLHYGEDEITKNGLINAPGFVEELAAAAFGGLVGRALEWGRPLAVLGFLALLLRLARPLPVSARLVGLLATGFSLWFITAAARSTVSQPETSRYIYLGAVVIVLVAVELLRGVTIAPRATGLATLVVGFCAVTGLPCCMRGRWACRNTRRRSRPSSERLNSRQHTLRPAISPTPSWLHRSWRVPTAHRTCDWLLARRYTCRDRRRGSRFAGRGGQGSLLHWMLLLWRRLGGQGPPRGLPRQPLQPSPRASRFSTATASG